MAWQATNQSVALGLDLLGEKGWDTTVWSRAALFGGGLWTNAMLRFYSHEVAHEYVYRAHNVTIRNALDFQNWKSSYIPGLYYPSWRQGQVNPYLLSDDELISATIAGLNQDELNADAVWHSSISRNAISFYDAQSYLLSKFRDVEYIAKSGSDEAPFAPGQQLHQLQYDVYAETPHLFDDVNLYRLALLNNGHHISNQQLLNRSLFADMLSWHTWENAWAIVSYLANGKSTRPFAFQLGQSIHLMPPLFSHYMTTTGSFFNSAYIVSVHEQKYQIEIGSTVGFTKIQAFRRYRVGLKVIDVKLAQNWRTRPYVYLNGQSGLHVNGFAVGSETLVPISQRLAATLHMEYHQNDLLESLVKRERNGFRSVFGFQMMF